MFRRSKSPESLLVQNGDLLLRQRLPDEDTDFVRASFTWRPRRDMHISLLPVLWGHSTMEIPVIQVSDGKAEIHKEYQTLRLRRPTRIDQWRYKLGRSLLGWK